MANSCDSCAEMICLLSKCKYHRRQKTSFYFHLLLHSSLTTLTFVFHLIQLVEVDDEDEPTPIGREDLNVLINYVNVWNQK